MKKIYQSPILNITLVNISGNFLTTSPGVTTGSTPGDEYNSGDPEYVRGHKDDDEFDEEDELLNQKNGWLDGLW